MLDRDQQKKPREPLPGDTEPAPPRFARGFILWIVVIVIVLLLATKLVDLGKVGPAQISLDEFQAYLDAGAFKSGLISGTKFIGELKETEDKQPRKVEVQLSEQYVERHMPKIEAAVPKLVFKEPSMLWPALWGFLPWLGVLFLFWFFLARQFRTVGGPGGVFAFGKSRARLSTKRTGVTFADVAGIDEAKEEVQEIIAFLKNPERFRRLGGRIPRGVLLVGAPGTGKTLLAKAIAGEADVPFFSISGSDFVEMFVGVGASRVRDLFRLAKEHSPCIIFLDEVDAVGRRRGTGLGGGHDEREQTLNAILVEMDGFDRDEGVIVIAATNRPDVLDPALLRPGRFDREIVVDLPDVKGREEILSVKVSGMKAKLGPDVDLSVLARSTPGLSGADLEAIVNEAAIRAAMDEKEHISMNDLEEARDKVIWGRQKRSRVMSERERRVTAYHEGGHALVRKLLPDAEPFYKATIVPQGVWLGATMHLPEADRVHTYRKQALAEITVLSAGRAAESLACDDISAGAQGDIKQATELARRMVCEWGMSESLGIVSYTEGEEHLFLGRELTRTKTHSEAMALEIDREIKRIIDSCYEKAEALLRDHKGTLGKIAEALLRYEVVDAADLEKIMAGQEIDSLRSPRAAKG